MDTYIKEMHGCEKEQLARRKNFSRKLFKEVRVSGKEIT